MNRGFTILLLLIWMVSFAQAQKGYLKVKAQKGDGIYLLLGRFGLDQSDCNMDKFCRLNRLKRNSYLMVGRSYYLPIQRYTYNGRSIRSTVGINDWHTAKQIERYNDLMCDLKLKTENFRYGQRELWCPHHLRACAVDLEKFVPQSRYFKIFGPELAQVPLKDKKLAGAIYYIVSGHGGPDPGATSSCDGQVICEDEYAYDISLRLARELLQHGALVYLITRDHEGIQNDKLLDCDETEYCWGDKKIPAGQSERLTQRSDIVNSLYKKNKARGATYQRLIEIHVDSRSRSQRIDLFFYYYPGSKTGKALAEKMHATMKDKYSIYRSSGQYNGDVTARDLHMLREVIPTPVFIEVGNIQNKNDQKRITLHQNRQALADWLAEGLMKDY